jgi:hypothetical protein
VNTVALSSVGCANLVTSHGQIDAIDMAEENIYLAFEEFPSNSAACFVIEAHLSCALDAQSPL